MRAALASLLLFIDEEPALARLCVVEAPGAGERVLERRSRLLAEVADVVGSRPPRRRREAQPAGDHGPGRGRSDRLDPAHAPAGASQGVGDRAARTVNERDRAPLPGSGTRAARSEQAARSPSQARTRAVQERDPLEGLNIRLTYRTVRVLVTLAEHPGASNREVSERADIVDQGQISKLLTRLAGLGLVENHGDGQPEGSGQRVAPDGVRREHRASGAAAVSRACVIASRESAKARVRGGTAVGSFPD